MNQARNWRHGETPLSKSRRAFPPLPLAPPRADDARSWRFLLPVRRASPCYRVRSPSARSILSSAASCRSCSFSAFPLLLAQLVQLAVQRHDLHLSLQVHLVVVSGMEAIPRREAVLTHHDDGCLQGADAVQGEVEQKKRIRVEGTSSCDKSK